MGFPSTSLLDTFNRPDENPTTRFDDGMGGIANGQIVNHAVQHVPDVWVETFWADSRYGPDAEAWGQLETTPNQNGDAVHLYVRASGATTMVSGYKLTWLFQGNTESDSLEIFRSDEATLTQLSIISGFHMAAGDRLGFRVVGSLLTAWHQPVNGTWTEITHASDSTYTGSGSIGFGIDNQGTAQIRISEFGGGTVTYNCLP